MTPYELTTVYIIAMEFFLAITLIKVIKFTDVSYAVKRKSAFVFGIWFAVVVTLFEFVKILPVDMSSLSLFILILIGVAFSGLFFYLLKEVFLALPQELLLLPQAFRMFFGAGFIVEAVYGIIPSVYGIVDGVMHITSAFLAVTLAIYIARGCKCKRPLLLVNLFGLLDIVIVAAGIAFVILPQIGTGHNVFLAVFFAAPIFIWLHLISLYRLFIDEGKEVVKPAIV